jgi:hypothetical protein
MATTTTIQSNYNGKVAGGLFLKSWKESDVLKNGAVDLLENVNQKISFRKLQTTEGETEYACGFAPAGSITLSEVSTTPVKFKSDWDLCKEDFRATWSADELGSSAHNDNFSKEILDGIIADKLAQHGEKIGKNIWQATDAVNGYDGFIAKFLADENVIDVDGTSVTKANVLAELEKVITASPAELNGSDLVLSVSRNVAQAYNFYLIAQGTTNGLGGNANTALVYGDYTMVVDKGLPANTMVLADPKNLKVVTGALADHNEVKSVDEDSIPLYTGKIRGTIVYNIATALVYGAEVVFYSVPVVE